MEVLSLFNGMGCIWYALNRLNIKVTKRYVCELDKYANKTNDFAFSDTIHLGDVNNWREWPINWKKIDLVAGGSPCQGFSFAGKQLNFNDPRSKLFFVFVEIWEHVKKHNPKAFFLFENVDMKKQYMRVINEYLGLTGVCINSNLVSAQNRKRWYWTNIRTKKTGLFGELQTNIPLPADKGLLLKDILQPEYEINEKYYIKNIRSDFDGLNLLKKYRTLRIGGQSTQSNKHNNNIIKVDKAGRIKANHNKAGCLTAGGNSGGNHSDMDLICVSMRGRNIIDDKRKDIKGAKTIQRLEANTNNKTNCLTSVNKDNLVFACDYRADEGLRIKSNNKSGTLTARARNDESCGQLAIQNYMLRRLTPRECGRLQTFTDKELNIILNSGVSDTQLYKQFGNGWTIEVIAHILSYLPKV